MRNPRIEKIDDHSLAFAAYTHSAFRPISHNFDTLMSFRNGIHSKSDFPAASDLHSSADLIFTAALGYGAQQLEIFADSLRATGCRAPVIALTNRLERNDTERLASWGFYPLIPQELAGTLTSEWEMRLLGKRARMIRKLMFAWFASGWNMGMHERRWRAALAAPFHHGMLARYLWAYIFLSRLTECRRVVLADSRDVVFQTDPFEGDYFNNLVVSLEDGRGSIGKGEHLLTDTTYDFVLPGGQSYRGINASWIHKVYGNSGLEAIAHCPISCAGVTLGPFSDLVHYLEQMTEEVVRNTKRLRGNPGLDQAMHNHLVWTEALPGVKIRRNEEGPVFTAHGVPDEELKFDSAGLLLTADNKPYAIVHQYDRSQFLAEHYATRLWRQSSRTA